MPEVKDTTDRFVAGTMAAIDTAFWSAERASLAEILAAARTPSRR